MLFSRLLFICALTLIPAFALRAQPAAAAPQAKKPESPPTTPPSRLSAAEFTGLIREFSEEGGSFYSDNLLSNETSYLHIVDKLQSLGVTGGAYLGVGPEQNFTYIAKVRPRIAFIIDIRHMAAIQHLLYKAIFHLSPTRAEFLARLLSRRLPKEKAPAASASLDELLAYFKSSPPDEKFYQENLVEIRKVIEEKFEYRLTESEQKELGYVHKSFRNDGLGLTYQWNGSSMAGYFPTLLEVIAETDLNGKQGNFLASVDDYDFVRDLQQRNLIIPVTGNFAGRKSLASIGQYLRKFNLTVSVFYLSNVEQYLFEDNVFDDFAANIRRLPIDDKSFFIRSVLSRFGHPATVPGHQFVTLLQRMPIFLKDYDEGRYKYYSTLVNSNYIAPGRK